MKTLLLCILFLVIGAIAGSAVTGFFVNRFHQRYYAFFIASSLGLDAMNAEMIKLGEASTVVNSLEKSFPDRVISIKTDETMKDSMTADTAMMATKRFYVCTKTPIPEQIDEILAPVSLPEDACPREE